MSTEITRVKQFQTSPEAEAKGQVMLAWLTHQLEAYTRPRLEAYGITEIDPDAWYSFQLFLDIMHDIVQSNENVTMTLVAIGKAVVENLPVSDFETVQDFEDFMDKLHSFSVRHMPPYERHIIDRENDRIFHTNNTPVSNDMIYGFMWELLRRYTIGGRRYHIKPYQDYPSDTGSVFLLEPLE